MTRFARRLAWLVCRLAKECETAMPLRSFRDLIVWQKAMLLAREIYQLVKMLPVEEHQAGFMKGEKKSLILSTHKIIDAFEKEDING